MFKWIAEWVSEIWNSSETARELPPSAAKAVNS